MTRGLCRTIVLRSASLLLFSALSLQAGAQTLTLAEGWNLPGNSSTATLGVLGSINGGEGFWVNSSVAFNMQLPAGAALTTASLKASLVTPGWNLLSSGDNLTPEQFGQALRNAPISHWAWRAAHAIDPGQERVLTITQGTYDGIVNKVEMLKEPVRQPDVVKQIRRRLTEPSGAGYRELARLITDQLQRRDAVHKATRISRMSNSATAALYDETAGA